MVKNSPCNSGHIGSTPGQETKIPHATEQLSPARMKHDKLQVKLSLHITLILFNKSSPPHSPQVMKRRDFHHQNYRHHLQSSDQGTGAQMDKEEMLGEHF